ncbi:MAG: translation initiation factor IF-2, partial [Candidatus Omnitrophica bacterium]|nr:translation initiation factor IF-2 [Candidatus Omnitrophota bacterium]
TAMRARGAMVTDVVVLVVAADDGVMPQTKEAIAHARAAGVPILVAINKIDVPGANVDRVKQQLAEADLIPEDWGGKTPTAEISALKKVGIEELVDLIHLQAELLELKASESKRPKGTVVEARLEQGRGVVTTALIQDGTLRIGDAIVAGVHSGKVRALMNDHGQRVDEAKPGMPVAIMGLSGAPVAGDELRGVPDERTARDLAAKLQQIQRDREMAKMRHVTLENLFAQIEEGSIKDLNLIVKADVQGSAEAVCESLMGIESSKVKVNILHRGVGAVSESDIMLASASEAIVLAFNVPVPQDVAPIRDQEGVDVRTYNVIYDAIEDIKKAMLGLLEDERREVVLGHFEVLKIFRSSKAGLVIGGMVTSGRLVKGAKVRVIRDERIAFDGKLETLRRFKDDVSEVTEGLECGVGIENFQDLREHDILECYQMESVAATL